MDRVGEPGERAARREQDDQSDCGGDGSGEREGRHDADPLAEASHDRDLNGARNAGDEAQGDGERVPSRHRGGC